MNWFTGLPLAISLPLFVGGFVLVSCLIVLALRPVVRRIVDDAEQWDRVLGHVIGTFGVFFGILLALVAVSVYENYSDTREAALHEAGQITALYRGTTGFPEEVAAPLQETIKEYLRVVIEEDWPDQRRGELPDASLELVDELEADPRVRTRGSAAARRVPAAPGHLRRLRRDTAGPHRCDRARTSDAVLDRDLGRRCRERRAHRPHYREEPPTAPRAGRHAGIVHRTRHVHHGGHGPAISGSSRGRFRRVRARGDQIEQMEGRP